MKCAHWTIRNSDLYACVAAHAFDSLIERGVAQMNKTRPRLAPISASIAANEPPAQ